MADISIRRLRQLYRRAFRNDAITLDHLIPKSRNGSLRDEFNIFPFEESRHEAWHFIFLNMTIFEVWEWFEQIHSLIFNSRQEKICLVWLSACCLEKGRCKQITKFEQKKKNLLLTLFDVDFLKKKWILCFGNAKLKTARIFLKYRMLFMIFGSKMIVKEYLLSNDIFTTIIQKAANYPVRMRAIKYCFGPEMPSPHEARAIFNEIMRSVIQQ